MWVNEWVIHDGMPYVPIQGQGHGGPKVVIMADICYIGSTWRNSFHAAFSVESTSSPAHGYFCKEVWLNGQ